MFQNQSLIDRVSAAETEAAEQKNKLEELEYNLENANNLIEKLDRHLSEANVKLKNYQEGEIQVTGGGEGVSKNKVNFATIVQIKILKIYKLKINWTLGQLAACKLVILKL